MIDIISWRRFSGPRASVVCLITACLSCSYGGQLAELRRRLETQEQRLAAFQLQQKKDDEERDKRTEELASKVECDNSEVRGFIKKCTSDEVCDEGKVVSAVRNMKVMDHVMLRVSYQADKPLVVDNEDRRAQIFKLILKHQIISGITKLLIVAIPSLDKATPAIKKSRPSIDYTKLHKQARVFRNSLYGSDFTLSKSVKSLDPQVPRCDQRTEGLVQIFHGNPDDQLLAGERKIQAPYVDLIIFLVEC